MSSIGSNSPGAPPSSVQAAQAEIQRLSAEVRSLAKRLEQQIAALEPLLLQEPVHPGPNASPAQLAAYQANLDKQLQALALRLLAAQARDQAARRAAIASL